MSQAIDYHDQQFCLSADNVSCIRADRLLFANLDVELKSGQGLRVAGENGRGKSSLLRILAGLFTGFEGEVNWNNSPLRSQRANYNNSLLYIGHEIGIKSVLTPRENLQWWLDLHSLELPTGDIISGALAEVGLAPFADQPSINLSAGQKRRVALARLFLPIKKPVWILDEPFTAIDVEGVQHLEQRFVEHLDSGGMLVVTTHQSTTLNRLETLSLDSFAQARYCEEIDV